MKALKRETTPKRQFDWVVVVECDASKMRTREGDTFKGSALTEFKQNDWTTACDLCAFRQSPTIVSGGELQFLQRGPWRAVQQK
jgi:hypothetical protein